MIRAKLTPFFYGCVYKRSSKPVMKGSRVEFIEEARKEYKELLAKGWGKLINSIVFLKKWLIFVIYLKYEMIKK